MGCARPQNRKDSIAHAPVVGARIAARLARHGMIAFHSSSVSSSRVIWSSRLDA